MNGWQRNETIWLRVSIWLKRMASGPSEWLGNLWEAPVVPVVARARQGAYFCLRSLENFTFFAFLLRLPTMKNHVPTWMMALMAFLIHLRSTAEIVAASPSSLHSTCFTKMS